MESQNYGSWGFSGPGTLKKHSPEKMLSNGTIERETGDMFIAPILGSIAAADPLEGQVPLVLDMISDGRIWPSIGEMRESQN